MRSFILSVAALAVVALVGFTWNGGVQLRTEPPPAITHNGKKVPKACGTDGYNAIVSQHVLAREMKGRLELKKGTAACPLLYWAEFVPDIRNPKIVTLTVTAGSRAFRSSSQGADARVESLGIATYPGEKVTACVAVSSSFRRCVSVRAAA